MKIYCRYIIKVAGILSFLSMAVCFGQQETALFDGKTLEGWNVKPEDKQFWSIEDGVIVAHNNGKPVPRNTYLFTEKKYEHFELRCKFRLTGDPETGVINSGIQFRTQNKNWEPKGYQADIGGPSWWGGIFEEGGRRKLAPANMKKVLPVVKENDWNEYVIRANGPRINLYINGVETVNYVENEPAVPYKGVFAIQLHKGGVAKIEVKDINLVKLDGGVDPNDAPAWRAAKKRITYNELQISNTPLTAQEQQKKFSLADGFDIELVAQESEGIGKFIAVDFDASGKMWSMTALDYPVDEKKEKAKAKALFENGGKDKILVFDTPTAKGVQAPRVFATKLAIPLGVMPYKNGAIAQYGEDIRHYQDTNNDGVADKYEVLLTGFGIEDSHLFPHQFTRGPGGWMYMAQGLANFSNIVRPDGKPFSSGEKSVKYDRCRVVRMQLDGSDFQMTTTGPNNVWGLVFGRDGERFIQEANDKGYPVAKYDFGVYLDTGGTPKLKPYQPILPPVFDSAIMGGTGLSGLVLAEDVGTSFGEEGKKKFYIANPLTSSIQVITATPLGNNRFKWEKQEDLLTSEDKWFRPVGIKFGPDGALYVVDWYNKIIAHGEVAQNHPDRDKVRGRIWRITPKGHKHRSAPNIAEAKEADLFNYLSDNNALIQRLAWLEIVDRKATSLIPELKEVVLDKDKRLDVRLAALWAAEGLEGVDAEILMALHNDQQENMRAEVVRVAGRVGDIETFAKIAKKAVNDEFVRVRNAAGEALVTRYDHSADTMHAAALLGKESISNSEGYASYEREFERFLARWAMENNTEETVAMLGQAEDLSVENRLLATQTMKPEQAVIAFLTMIPKLDRDLTTTELSLITGQLKQVEVLSKFKALLFDPRRQQKMLQSLSNAEPDEQNKVLNELLIEACLGLIKRDETEENQLLVMKVAQKFQLLGLAKDIEVWTSLSSQKNVILAGLRCLRELGAVDKKLSMALTSYEDEAVRREAVIALATTLEVSTIKAVKERWGVLSATDRQSAINGLMNSKEKSIAFSRAVLNKEFGELDKGSIEKMILVLGDEPESKKLLKLLGDSVPMIIRMAKKGNGSVNSEVSLAGSFTVEGWIRLPNSKQMSSQFLANAKGSGLVFKNGKLEVAVARKKAKAKALFATKAKANSNVWTHYALVRDTSGVIHVYVDGTLDSSSKGKINLNLKGLTLGGKRGDIDLMEFRVWSVAKNEEQVRSDMQVSYVGKDKPASLSLRVSGNSEGLSLKGNVRIAPASDAPELITSKKAAELAAEMKRYKEIIKQSGDAVNGKVLFSRSCTACHQVNKVGVNIGPDLSGIGASTDEGLLRNILTPNASVAAGYYSHTIKLKNGSFVNGFMLNEDDEYITIRSIGVDDKKVLKSQIDSHTVSKRSLMPEGLISGMSEQEVADLFAYMRTLKPIK